MSTLDDLIKEIPNVDLRRRIEEEVKKLRSKKKFGLVFDSHQPECTPLYDTPIKRDSIVALKAGKLDDLYRVQNIDGDNVNCLKEPQTDETYSFKLDELVSVARFGEPIYPYLQQLDDVINAPDSDLWHVLIEADNYHALQLLQYVFTDKKVDCIYIDPPYNTGARDWKYNNDYVDANDLYRHSKWLSMMHKRLLLAKKILNPSTGVLIIAIDDNEKSHLIVMIEEIFPEYDISSVIVNHHPQGGAADNISRTHEYAIFITPKGKKLIKGEKVEIHEERWSLMRGGTDIRNLRKGRPNSFYAIYVDLETLTVRGVGPHLEVTTPYDKNKISGNTIALYPLGKDGTERVWRYERESMIEHIKNHEIICTPNLSLMVLKKRDVKYAPVFSVWTDSEYNAGTYGTNLIRNIFAGENRFPYPKSLYNVYDCIRYSTRDNPDAIIIDFFAGSGTTMHAVNLFNAEDGGQRRCILVTNNEVSADEEKSLKDAGYTPSDTTWQELGIARYVTWKRIVCSIEGHDINGVPLKGTYLGSDIPMADGFRANAAFFKLGFLDKNSVALGRQFKEILPIIWLKAGSVGRCPSLSNEDTLPPMMILPENKFAVLLDEKYFLDFEEAVLLHSEIETVFIVTDSSAGYKAMIQNFGDRKTYQLYRDYLENFRINVMK